VKAFYEFGLKQLTKKGEELCGDNVEFSIKPFWATLVFSDGLGSGVKASILSTLTTRIATVMLDEGLPIEEVVQTIGETLPICRVRKIAYSTFAMAQLFTDGHVKLMELDNPPAFFLRGKKIRRVPSEEHVVDSKSIREYSLTVRPGDWLVFVSDGVINAGIGGAYPLGWGWDLVAKYLESHVHRAQTAGDLAEKLVRVVEDLYSGPPGDDVSVAVIKVRRKRIFTVMTGPPANREDDPEIVKALMAASGRRAICGGTTATIVARELGRGLQVDLDTGTDDVPAMARIDGMDLVTEGVLTLTKVLGIMKSDVPVEKLKLRTDGASALAVRLHEADQVVLLVGRAMNPAHQNPELPKALGIKTQVAHSLAGELRHRGKEVEVRYY